MGGEITFNLVNDSRQRNKDKYDIAILKLNNESYNNIKHNFVFIPKTELGINHEDVKLEDYTSIGFPASKSKFNSFKNSFKSTPLIYSSELASYETYEQLKCNASSNIIVHFEKENNIMYQGEQKIIAPDPFGMSGCGLWHIPLQVVSLEQNIKKYLVGIMTEWPIENRHFLIGTRIDHFTEVIRQKYKLNIQKSNKIMVRV